jgi:hypothetical protein
VAAKGSRLACAASSAQPLLLFDRQYLGSLFNFSQRAHGRRIAQGTIRRKPDSASCPQPLGHSYSGLQPDYNAQRKIPSTVDQIRPAARSRVRNSEGNMIGMP